MLGDVEAVRQSVKTGSVKPLGRRLARKALWRGFGRAMRRGGLVMQATGYRFMNVSVTPVMDSDVVDGKFIARQRYVATISLQGHPVVDLAGDTAPEAIRNVAMWMESEGFEF